MPPEYIFSPSCGPIIYRTIWESFAAITSISKFSSSLPREANWKLNTTENLFGGLPEANQDHANENKFTGTPGKLLSMVQALACIPGLFLLCFSPALQCYQLPFPQHGFFLSLSMFSLATCRKIFQRVMVKVDHRT